MRIILDTNVIISGVFFGGYPHKVLEKVVYNNYQAFASEEIIKEYKKTIDRINQIYGDKLDKTFLSDLLTKISIVDVKTKIDVSRDKKDNMFIECAIDSNALYIVSGDMDLLVIEEYKGIQIVTAKEFCETYIDK